MRYIFFLYSRLRFFHSDPMRIHFGNAWPNLVWSCYCCCCWQCCLLQLKSYNKHDIFLSFSFIILRFLVFNTISKFFLFGSLKSSIYWFFFFCSLWLNVKFAPTNEYNFAVESILANQNINHHSNDSIKLRWWKKRIKEIICLVLRSECNHPNEKKWKKWTRKKKKTPNQEIIRIKIASLLPSSSLLTIYMNDILKNYYQEKNDYFVY